MPDQTYTENVATKAGPKANPRAKLVFSSLIRHLHAFAREVELTNEEWLMACESLVEAGKISGTARNEMILISDVLGVEALLDEMTHARFQKATAHKLKEGKDNLTVPNILGPFYRPNPPSYKNGESIVLTHEPNDVSAHIYGTVTDVDGSPIVGAHVDIWHTGSHGFYDSQIYDPKNSKTLEYNWRGRLTTDDKGRYDVHCLRPTAYPIPFDYTAGHILDALDRSPMRPAHIHLYVKAPGYKPLVTQIYDSGCEFVKDDAVFAVRDSLVVDFKEIGEKKTELEFNIVIIKDLNDSSLNGV